MHTYRQPDKAGCLIFRHFLFVFVIPMIRGFISNQEKYQNFVEVDAIITNITKSNTDKTKLMEYQYKHDGKKYTAERNELFTHGKKIGDTVTIKCNPKNPSEIQDGSDTFFLFMIFIINFKPGNPMPLGAGRKGSFFTKKMKNLLFFYSLLKNPAY